MNTIRTELWTYQVKREVPCVVCGQFFEQANVAVVVFDGAQERGELCSGCLATPTQQAAGRLRQRGARLARRSPLWAQELAVLAGQLDVTDDWGVTVAALRTAEQAARRRRLPAIPSRERHALIA